MRTSRECEGVDKKKGGPALWSDSTAVQISVCETVFLPTLCIPAPHPSTFPETRAHFREDCQELGHEAATALCSPPTGRVSQGHLAAAGFFITPGPSSTQPVRSYTWTHLPTNLLLLPWYHCLQEWHYYYGYLASHQEQNTVFIFKNHYRLLRVREGSIWTNFP